MSRCFAIVCTLLGLALFMGTQAVDAQAVKAQMVKGPIKSLDSDTMVLVIKQKVGTEIVDRQLSITKDIEFTIMLKNGEKRVASGRDAMVLLEQNKATGAMAQVKCDKDVNVLSVKVTIK